MTASPQPTAEFAWLHRPRKTASNRFCQQDRVPGCSQRAGTTNLAVRAGGGHRASSPTRWIPLRNAALGFVLLPCFPHHDSEDASAFSSDLCTSVSITASPTTESIGTPIQLTATATCASGDVLDCWFGYPRVAVHGTSSTTDHRSSHRPPCERPKPLFARWAQS